MKLFIVLTLVVLGLAACSATETTSTGTVSSSSSGPSMAQLTYRRGVSECAALRSQGWSQTRAVRAVRGETVDDLKTIVADGCAKAYG